MSRLHGSHGHEHAPETEGHVIHWASFYDILTGLLFLGREETVRKMIVDLARVQPGEKVLDVGCGTGNLTIQAKSWAGSTGEVHGIDAAPEMIHRAHRKAARAGVDVDFKVGLVEDIPFPDDEFDVVLSSLMIHHVPGDDLKRKGFAEMHRVLKPGGRLLVVDFVPPTQPVLRALTSLVIGHVLGGEGMMRNDVRRLLPLVEAAGFVDVETGPTDHWALAFVRGRAKDEVHAQA